MDYAGLKTPGVYINEISTLPASIVAVETAIPAFIGYAEKLMSNNMNLLADADLTPEYRRISSMKEYEDIFGHDQHSSVVIGKSALIDRAHPPLRKDRGLCRAPTAPP